MTKRVPILRKKSFEPHIVDCDYFTVDKVVLDGQRMKKIFGEIDKTSFASLLVLDGAGKVQSGEESVDVQKGDSLVGICRKIYQTTAMMDKVCEANGIDDPDAIYAGQYLTLPN